MARSFKLCIVALTLALALTIDQTHALEVTFETQAQLDSIGATSTCSYFENYEELCKKSPAHPGSLGYWSSCEAQYCEITIPLNQILKSADDSLASDLPSQVRVLSYVNETRAEIRIRYKLTPNSMTINLNPPVPASRDWTASPNYDLENIVGINSESEIVLRLSSNPFQEDSDILDKIIFTFGSVSESTTTSTTPRISTTEDSICFE